MGSWELLSELGSDVESVIGSDVGSDLVSYVWLYIGWEDPMLAKRWIETMNEWVGELTHEWVTLINAIDGNRIIYNPQFEFLCRLLFLPTFALASSNSTSPPTSLLLQWKEWILIITAIDWKWPTSTYSTAGDWSDGEGDEGAEQGVDKDKRIIFWFLELNS